ncbi:unnamed protein product [Choristocarpus tenellus]
MSENIGNPLSPRTREVQILPGPGPNMLMISGTGLYCSLAPLHLPGPMKSPLLLCMCSSTLTVVYNYTACGYASFSPGAMRVFEMQLMPALLFKMGVEKYATQGNSGAKVPQEGEGSCKLPEGESIGDLVVKGVSSTSLKAVVSTTCDSFCSRDAQPQGDCGQSEEGDGVEEEGVVEEEDKARVPAPSAAQHEEMRVKGMDWGVVGVWSCPLSCNKSFEECVIVQPPE